MKDVTGQETIVAQSFSVDGTQPYFDFHQRLIIMSDIVCLVSSILDCFVYINNVVVLVALLPIPEFSALVL